MRFILGVSLLPSLLLFITQVEGTMDYVQMNPSPAAIPPDVWYAELEAERDRFARDTEYSSPEEEEEDRHRKYEGDHLLEIIDEAENNHYTNDDDVKDDNVKYVNEKEEEDSASSSSEESSEHETPPQYVGELEEHLEDHLEKHVEDHLEEHVEHHAEEHLDEHLEEHLEQHAEEHLKKHLEAHADGIEHHDDAETLLPDDYSAKKRKKPDSCKREGESCTENPSCCSRYCSWTRGFTCYSIAAPRNGVL